jgi:hypothetical protein
LGVAEIVDYASVEVGYLVADEGYAFAVPAGVLDDKGGSAVDGVGGLG